MNFRDYYEALPKGGRRELAKSIGIDPSFLGQLARGDRPVPAARWANIVAATGGRVSFQDLAEDAARRAAA